MDQMGVYFVAFVSQYGYDRVLSVLGRHMRDFLNGLDNLHEYLKFSYPLMRAPSFICENETRHGLTLHYRTKRKGFVYYTMGQIREVSRKLISPVARVREVMASFQGGGHFPWAEQWAITFYGYGYVCWHTTAS